jgi:hypothetical protein
VGLANWDDVDIPGLPGEIEPHLRSAEHIELLSLDPFVQDQTPAGFHRFKVLGFVRLAAGEPVGFIVDQVLQGVHPWPGWRCVFVPRHGLRARQDTRSLDLVICFECGELHVHRSWADMQRVGMSRQAKELLNGVLVQAGVTLSPG